MNAADHPEREKGDGEECFQKGGVGQFDAPGEVPGGQNQPFAVEGIDDDLQPVAGGMTRKT